VPGESEIDLESPDALNDVFAVLRTFLFKEIQYQKAHARQEITGEPALWLGEARAHGSDGIAEAMDSMEKVRRNDPCPCGSGKRFKNCHMRIMG
jgi:preprotein translocase subunit SecA